jgi:hypothetical protein
MLASFFLFFLSRTQVYRNYPPQTLGEKHDYRDYSPKTVGKRITVSFFCPYLGKTFRECMITLAA